MKKCEASTKDAVTVELRYLSGALQDSVLHALREERIHRADLKGDQVAER